MVTFALIVYHQEQYIREAVEGAFAQTYSPLEIIISDDCSPDPTFEIIQEMAAAYKGPHKIILNRNQTNLGFGANVRKCLEMASGEWAIMAAGDDISLPERSSLLMKAAEREPNVRGIWSNFERIDSEGMVLERQGLHSDELDIKSSDLDSYLWGRPKRLPPHASGCAAAWHRSVFSIHNYIPEDCWCEDLFFSVRCLALGHDLLRLSPDLVKYRSHESNLSGFRRSNTQDGNSKLAAIIHKTIQTCHFLEDDIKQIIDTETRGIEAETASRLLFTLQMMTLRWKLDSKIHNRARIKLGEILRLRDYYTRFHLALLIRKWALGLLNRSSRTRS